MATTTGETPRKRTPLTPEQVERAKTQDEIDFARVDTYDEAISQVTDALDQMQRVRDQIEASAAARAKLVAEWPRVDEARSVWVPARAVDRDWRLWQHHCGRIVPGRHEPTATDECGRCGDAPVLPGDWRQLYVRASEADDDR